MTRERGHATYLPCLICGAQQGQKCKSLNPPFGARSRPHMARRKPTREHGSDAGYQRHVKRGEVPCDECKRARAAKMREYRSDPTVRAQTNAENSARAKAVWRLAALHRQEYAALVREEMAKQFPGEAAS